MAGAGAVAGRPVIISQDGCLQNLAPQGSEVRSKVTTVYHLYLKAIQGQQADQSAYEAGLNEAYSSLRARMKECDIEYPQHQAIRETVGAVLGTIEGLQEGVEPVIADEMTKRYIQERLPTKVQELLDKLQKGEIAQPIVEKEIKEFVLEAQSFYPNAAMAQRHAIYELCFKKLDDQLTKLPPFVPISKDQFKTQLSNEKAAAQTQKNGLSEAKEGELERAAQNAQSTYQQCVRDLKDLCGTSAYLASDTSILHTAQSLLVRTQGQLTEAQAALQQDSSNANLQQAVAQHQETVTKLSAAIEAYKQARKTSFEKSAGLEAFQERRRQVQERLDRAEARYHACDKNDDALALETARLNNQRKTERESLKTWIQSNLQPGAFGRFSQGASNLVARGVDALPRWLSRGLQVAADKVLPKAFNGAESAFHYDYLGAPSRLIARATATSAQLDQATMAKWHAGWKALDEFTGWSSYRDRSKFALTVLGGGLGLYYFYYYPGMLACALAGLAGGQAALSKAPSLNQAATWLDRQTGWSSWRGSTKAAVAVAGMFLSPTLTGYAGLGMLVSKGMGFVPPSWRKGGAWIAGAAVSAYVVFQALSLLGGSSSVVEADKASTAPQVEGWTPFVARKTFDVGTGILKFVWDNAVGPTFSAAVSSVCKLPVASQVCSVVSTVASPLLRVASGVASLFGFGG